MVPARITQPVVLSMDRLYAEEGHPGGVNLGNFAGIGGGGGNGGVEPEVYIDDGRVLNAPAGPEACSQQQYVSVAQWHTFPGTSGSI